MKKLKLISGILLFLLLQACSVAPKMDMPEPEFAMPASFETAAEHEKYIVQVDSVIPKEWWKEFQDDALNRYIDTVIERNLDIRNSLENIELMKAQVRVAGVKLIPTASVSVGANKTWLGDEIHQPDMDNPGAPAQSELESFPVTAAMSYTLDIWGKVRNNRKAALQDLMASEQQLRSFYGGIITQSVSAWFQYQSALEVVELLHQNMELTQSQFDFQKERYVRGIGSKLEYEQSRASLASMKTDLASAEKGLYLAKVQVATLAGYYPGEFTPEKSALSLSERSLPNAYVALPSAVVKNRPDVIAAEHKLESARLQIGVARADFFPTFTLQASISSAESEIANMFSPDYFRKLLGANISQLIFARQAVKVNVTMKETLYRQAVLNYKKSLLTALTDVETALVELTDVENQSENFVEQLDATGKIYTEMQSRYLQGLVPFDRVIDAQKAWFSAQSGMLGLQQRRILSRVNVVSACGGLI